MCVLLILHLPTIFLTTVVTNTIKNIRKQLEKTAKDVHKSGNLAGKSSKSPKNQSWGM